MRRTVRSAASVLAGVLAAGTLGSPASASTTCRVGGPAPSASVARLELPHGSALHALRLSVTRPSLPVGGRAAWHVAAGVGIVDAASGQLVTARVINVGSSSRRVVATLDGERVVYQDVPAPDAPFEHQGGTPVPSLPAGTYYLVGFGADGDRAQPSAGWTAELNLEESITCSRVGGGDVFDVDHTEFSGGTQVSGYGAGTTRDVSYELTTDRSLVFGLIDAATQLTPTTEDSGMGAEVDYDFGGRRGIVRETIVPFAAMDRPLSFRARATGGFPLVLVSGVAFDIPGEGPL